jgi:hypothetical protein
LQEASQLNGDIENDSLSKHFNAHNFSLPFPKAFFAPEESPGPRKAKLTGVSLQGNSWELRVEGQWKAKVMLNDKYEVIGRETVQ